MRTYGALVSRESRNKHHHAQIDLWTGILQFPSEFMHGPSDRALSIGGSDKDPEPEERDDGLC